jgi:hemoglobin-like flavoprotein
MTPEQVTLVQQTFAQVVPVADKAAEAFYDRLFDVAPAVKPLFRGDMTEQRRKLMASLAVVVRGLSDLSSILPAASALAKRHVDYGATWAAAYTTLSDFMIEAAYGRPQAAE